ncbi:MAG TPA: sulfotransferase [Terriglobales bacterium]|nr:sulfotransferase [Terriglobales bacterium]
MPGPIFILGLSRSGTTLLSRILDVHSRIAILPETWCFSTLDFAGCLEEFSHDWQYMGFINRMWDYMSGYEDVAARVVSEFAAKLPRYSGPTRPILDALGKAYAKERGRDIWGEKTPAHVLVLPQIQKLFPEARVLVCVRDPRDVVLSYDEAWGGDRRDPKFLMRASAVVRDYIDHIFHQPGFPREQLMQVRYETLTSDPAATLQSICSFVGVEFEPQMLDFFQKFPESGKPYTPYHKLLSRPVTAERVARYQTGLSPQQIGLVSQFLKKEMELLEYPSTSEDPITPNRTSKSAQKMADSLWRDMKSGRLRVRERRKERFRLALYRWAGPLMTLRGKDFAVTREDWVERTRLRAEDGNQPSSQEGRGGASVETPVVELPMGQAPDLSEKGEQSHVAFRQQMSHVSQHSGVFFAGTILSAFLGYVFKIYLARHLGARLLGLYSLGMTMVAPLSIFNGMGLTLAALRFVPVYRAKDRPDLLRGFLVRSLGRLLLCNVLLAFVLWFVGPFVAREFYHAPELGKFVLLFAVLMVLGVMSNFLGQVLAGYRQVARRTVIITLVGPLLTMGLSIALISWRMELRGYILGQVIASAIITIILTGMVWRYTPGPAKQFRRGLPRIESRVTSYAIATLGLGVLEYLIGHADRIMLGFYRNAREVGIYSVAAAVVTFVSIVLRSINQVFAPMISDLHARQQQQLLGRLFQTLTKWIIGLTSPLAAAVIINAGPILHIFGPEFEAGWPVLVIGSLGQLVNCGVGSAGTILLMSGHQSSLVWIEGLSAGIMVLLNVLLIPHWGIGGAAIAAATTVVVTNVLYLILAHKKTGLFPYNRSYLRLLMPTLASCGLLALLRYAGFARSSPMVAIAIGLVLAYGVFVGLSLLFGLDAEDNLIVDAIRSRLRSAFSRS